MIPQLAWRRWFRLRANCVLPAGPGSLYLQTGAPVFPAEEPSRYDSKVEERFARDFCRATADWDLVREPRPVEAAGALVFPDFLLRHRHEPARRWLLEIVGFWTADYLARKLAHYRAARLRNLVLCIDADRQCSEADLPRDARVVRYRRRVRPEDVLAVVKEG